MREHWYRAWFHAQEPHYCKGVNVNADQMLYDSWPGECLLFKHQGQPVTVEEFTGLKDKNGKPIYEGDKLYFAAYKAIGVVEWSEDYMGWWVRLLDRDEGQRQGGSLFDFTTSIGWADSYKVVGNIHESKN